MRTSSCKFPQSVQLFKFCQKVLSDKLGRKVKDQDIGAILDFNPSDSSHWKRGEKHVRSVFALQKLADAMGVDVTLIQDLASGNIDMNSASFEYLESLEISKLFDLLKNQNHYNRYQKSKKEILDLVQDIHVRANFKTLPLYLPEIFRLYRNLSTQPADILDKLTRILKVKDDKFIIHFQKGELNAQIRLAMAKDLARILLKAERANLANISPLDADWLWVEELIFVANLLVPSSMIAKAVTQIDIKKSMVNELAALFWVPRTLVAFQLKESLWSQSLQLDNEVDKNAANTRQIVA